MQSVNYKYQNSLCNKMIYTVQLYIRKSIMHYANIPISYNGIQKFHFADEYPISFRVWVHLLQKVYTNFNVFLYSI